MSLFYEDFHVGQRFESSAHPMTRDRIVAFGTEFDPQPQHLGETEAQSSLFGTLVASGWHTASLTMRMQLECVFSRIPGGAMGASVEKLTWVRPVHPGDELRAVVEVRAMRLTRSRPDRGLLTLHTTTLDQEGRPVMEMGAAVLVPRRPAPPALTEV